MCVLAAVWKVLSGSNSQCAARAGAEEAEEMSARPDWGAVIGFAGGTPSLSSSSSEDGGFSM